MSKVYKVKFVKPNGKIEVTEVYSSGDSAPLTFARGMANMPGVKGVEVYEVVSKEVRIFP